MDDIETLLTHQLYTLQNMKNYEESVLAVMRENKALVSIIKDSATMEMSNETYFALQKRLKDALQLTYREWEETGIQTDNRVIIKNMHDKGSIDISIAEVKEKIERHQLSLKRERTKDNPFTCPRCGELKIIKGASYKAPEIEIACDDCDAWSRMDQWKQEGW